VSGPTLLRLHTHEPVVSTGAAAFLADHDASLAVLAGGRLVLFTGDADGRPVALELGLDSASALAWHDDRLWVTTGWQVWTFVDSAAGAAPGDEHLLLPQTAHTTGGLGVTDLGVGAGGPVIASGLFTCLATLDERRSMRPVWVPPGVDALLPETRWLLSGVALRQGLAAYVTAAGRSRAAEGWREGMEGGGVLMDVGGRVVTSGLTVPRQPRWHADHLVVVDGGSGRLLSVDPDSGGAETVVTLPGVLSALTVDHGVALVGRGDPERASVEGLAGGPAAGGASIAEGVTVVDLSDGSVVGTIDFEGHTGPITALALLPGIRRATVAAPRGTVLQSTVVMGETEKLGVR
jgi:uncharacterized protein (TIGR03032 family)